MKRLFYYETKIGKLGIAEEYGLVTNICFMSVKQPMNCKLCETDIMKEAYTQLEEYFAGKRKEFDIPINPSGTSYQQQVWCELLKIPYGETRSYKDIAVAMGNDKSSRAVGNANNKNPIPIIIPCHRVIGSDNKPVGYAGGIDIKNFLLNIEKTHC
ncbi:MAG: methylated-DNA--[protein]-cysteine S-methyltransferase [Candidatus Gastranaerophilales bacterium]|nr:methylated-DNA--[protein]-cysteine S-methyltransferase [Candidatus Gastranaerophilales bacterium]